MNYNILAYIIYSIIILLIIFWLGRKLHSIGRIYILALYKEDVRACDSMNNVLLIAYYLFNTGYAFLKLHNWQYVGNREELVYSVGLNIGRLLIILAATHYFNMTIIYFISGKRKNILPSKNQ